MQENLNDFWKVIVEYWFLIAMVITTVVMAMFRTAKQYGKIDYLEAAMCALFAYGVYFVLGWFKIPPEASVLVGGFVGWLGTAKIAAYVDGVLVYAVQGATSGANHYQTYNVSFIVPAGATYRIVGLNRALFHWAELR